MRSTKDDAAATNSERRDEMRKRLQLLFDLRAAGDFDRLMTHIAEDVVWFPPTSWGYARFPRTLRGKAAVREAFLERHIHYIFLPSTLHRVLVDGDQVALHRTSRARPRGGGVVESFNCIDFLRFRDGLIVEFSEFCDGAAREFVVHHPY